MNSVQVVGSYLSPYVRKLLVVLHLKQIPYEVDPIIPFFGNARFTAISPLRRVPILIDDEVTLADSTVICEYLEERYPLPALLPVERIARAKARWLEEFADTRMGEVFIWRLFNQAVINPIVWRQPTEDAVLQQTQSRDIPHVLDYLESQLPNKGYLFGELSLADIALATFFRNAAFSRYKVDPSRWPVTTGYVARILSHDAFARLVPFEERLVRTPIPLHRKVLIEMGAPIMKETFGTETPQRGLMQI